MRTGWAPPRLHGTRIAAMKPADTMTFKLRDRVENVAVGPGHVPLALLGQFQKDVAEFLTGSKRELDPHQVLVSILEGSLDLVAKGLLAAIGLWADVERLESVEDLGLIDPKRRAVIERWQAATLKHPERAYQLLDASGRVHVQVDARTDFRDRVESEWIPVDKYLHGLVTDLGGTSKANVHLKLDSGEVVVVASSQQLLAEQERNRLYKPALLQVAAEQNLRTREVRNYRLVAFAPEPDWDEQAFDAMVRKGTQAWSGVSEDWLEELRSGRG